MRFWSWAFTIFLWLGSLLVAGDWGIAVIRAEGRDELLAASLLLVKAAALGGLALWRAVQQGRGVDP